MDRLWPCGFSVRYPTALERAAAAAAHPTPDRQDDDRADHRADESGPFIRAIPAQGLPEEGGEEGADDAEDRGDDEAGRFVGSAHDHLRDDAGKKTDDDRPEDAHGPSFRGWLPKSVTQRSVADS